MPSFWKLAGWKLKNIPRNAIYLIKLGLGGLAYARRQKTPSSAYNSLRKLYCHTGGRSNDYLHALVSWLSPKYSLPPPCGLLGDLTETRLDHVVNHLREYGYYRFPVRLSEDLCNRLSQVALTKPAKLWPRADKLPEMAVYNREHPICEGYWLPEQTLIESQAVQQIISDPSFLAIAQSYLGCRPILDCLNMWWSTTAQVSTQGRSAMAQLYHFDMERIKWLKFFIYLTDVTPSNGPHCFVAKSHRTSDQSFELLRRGPVRIPDEDIRKSYSDQALMEFHGPRGTIIAEDTRGFHKGKPIEAGERLMFELDFCDSLFGGGYEKPTIPADCDPALRQVIARYPAIYSKFQWAQTPNEVRRAA